ncbi:MAG: hypothetical protein ACRDRT_09725 [Pseudonocardiaceae bacterium]
MTDPTRGINRGSRRAKRFLTPSQKYEIFLQLVRQEVTMAEAAEAWKVDRTTVLRIRTVAKQGALDALSASRPGVKAAQRDSELDAARADAARLGEAVKEMAVKLMLVEGKGVGAEWPGPRPCRRGHQGRPAQPDPIGPSPTAGAYAPPRGIWSWARFGPIAGGPGAATTPWRTRRLAATRSTVCSPARS